MISRTSLLSSDISSLLSKSADERPSIEDVLAYPLIASHIARLLDAAEAEQPPPSASLSLASAPSSSSSASSLGASYQYGTYAGDQFSTTIASSMSQTMLQNGAATAFSTVRGNPQQGDEFIWHQTHGNAQLGHSGTYNGALQSTSSFGTYGGDQFDRSVSTIRDSSEMARAREEMMMNGSVRAAPQVGSLNSVCQLSRPQCTRYLFW